MVGIDINCNEVHITANTYNDDLGGPVAHRFYMCYQHGAPEFDPGIVEN